MDFAYTPAQQELKARAAAYAELLMGYEDEAEQAGGPLPKETVDKLTRAAMDAGMFGINMPVEWGGAGLDPAGAGDRRGGVRQGHQLPVGYPVAAGERARPRVGRTARALPAADPARRAVRRVRHHRARRRFRRRRDRDHRDDGRRRLLINGEKWFVTCGDVADFLLVQANVLPGNESTLFFVEKDTPACGSAAPRASCTPPSTAIRSSCSRTSSSPTDAVLGEVGQGFELTKDWFTDERLMIAARTVGVAERALRLARRLGDTAQAVRRTDQRLPDDPGDAGRLRRRHRGEPSLHPSGRVGGRQWRGPEDAARQGFHREARPPARPRVESSTAACRSSAAAAMTGPTRSSGCTARCASTASGRAPPRSSV